MKILHIIPSLCKGGAERLVLDICIELQSKADFEVCLVTFSDKNEYSFLSDQINHKIIPSTYTPSISGKESKNISTLKQFILEFEPNIIHSHLWEAEMISRQINYPHAKWFTHFHDNMKQLRKTIIPTSKNDITDFLERKLMLKKYKALNNNFICISKDSYNYANDILPNNLVKNTNLLFNAINIENFNTSNKKPTDKIRLINIGSFVPKKNQQLAIDTIIYLKSINVEAELTLLGDGDLKTDLEKYALDNNVSEKIHFKGNVNDVKAELENSNFYLHTATYEPFGLVLLEAMAAGLPIISLDGGGNKDVIKDGENGYLLNSKATPKEFGTQIIELFNDKEEYNRIVENGSDFVKQFEISVYCKKLVKLYKEAISSAN